MRSLKTVIGAFVALLLVVFAVWFQGDIFQGIRRAAISFAGLFAESSYEEVIRLRTEVEALRAERATLLEAGIPPFSEDLRRIPVYSRYPYGAEGILTIAGGENEGIRTGAPVLATPGTLLGKVTKVERSRSEVMTIWSPAWRSSVGFEGVGTKALLEGGESPLLTLIPRGKESSAGTRVVNVDPSFPYGLFLGALGEADEDNEDPWLTATLQVPYGESDLREVLVLVNFP